MGSFTSLGTTFDIPNYTGPLFGVSPEETPLISMIGGLNGGRPLMSKSFEWETYDLKTAGYGTPSVEGGAPSFVGRTRTNVNNVTMIFKYGIEISYSALANVGQLASHYAGFTTDTEQTSGAEGANPVRDELAWQVMQKVKESAIDVNFEFWNSAFANPTTNAAGRRTRGLLEAIVTNLIVLDSGAAAAADLTGTPAADTTINGGNGPSGQTYIEDLLKQMYDNAAPMSANLVLFTNSVQKIKISQAYTDSGKLAPRDRKVGGVAVDTLILDFATVGVVLDRHLPQDRIVVLNVDEVMPAFTTVPGKGHFFVEPKPSDGDSVKAMLFGEIGVQYGPELWHGQLDNLTV